MNWVDFVILGIVGASLLAGLYRGAVKSVFSLVGIIVGFVAATRESGAVGIVLTRWMPDAAAAAVGFVLVFLGISLAFTLAARLLRKVLDGLSLGWLDRLAGVALGLIRGAVIVGVLALAVEGLGGFDAARTSPSYGVSLQTGGVLLEFIPSATRDRLDWERLRELIPREQMEKAIQDAAREAKDLADEAI